MSDWLEETYGLTVRDIERKLSYPPPLRITAGGRVRVKFMEERPRVIRTRYGNRAVIEVEVDGTRYSLWLRHVNLAIGIKRAEIQANGNLRDREAVIEFIGRRGRAYVYNVVLTK